MSAGHQPGRRRQRWWRLLRWPAALLAPVMLLMLLILLGPLAVMASGEVQLDRPWYASRSDSTGQAPDPTLVREAVVQV